MAESNTTRSGGVGVFSLLGIAFVILKLCGTITWSWWWVTAPFWVPLAFAVGVVLLVLLIVALARLTNLVWATVSK